MLRFLKPCFRQTLPLGSLGDRGVVHSAGRGQLQDPVTHPLWPDPSPLPRTSQCHMSCPPPCLSGAITAPTPLHSCESLRVAEFGVCSSPAGLGMLGVLHIHVSKVWDKRGREGGQIQNSPLPPHPKEGHGKNLAEYISFLWRHMPQIPFTDFFGVRTLPTDVRPTQAALFFHWAQR